jgi:hypothetical protein
MSSFTKLVSVFVLSGAACFAAIGCVSSADSDEDVSDAPQAQGIGGDLGGGDLGGGQFSKFSKFSKYNKKAPPIQAPVQAQPYQQPPQLPVSPKLQ